MTSYLSLGTKSRFIKVLEEDFKVFVVHQHSTFKRYSAPNDVTRRMLQNYTMRNIWKKWFLIKVAGKSISFPLLSLSNTITETIKFDNFDMHMVLTLRKTKKSWSKLKICQSMFLIEVMMRMIQGFLSWLFKWNDIHNYTLVMMWKAKFYQEKTWNIFLRNPCMNVLQSIF